MRKKNFISDVIDNVIARLEAHPDIIIDELTINPPAPKDKIDKETLIPAILKQFYKSSNGLVLRWHVKDDVVIRGGITMPLLENIHNTRWSSFGILDYTDDVHVAFQKIHAEDSRIMMESLEGDEDIEFSEMDESLINIKSYFSAFSKSFGFRFWQEHYRADMEYSIESIIENRCYLWGNGNAEAVPELHSAHVPN